MKRKLLVLLVLVGFSVAGYSQIAAVKTNLFYGAYTYTPNLSFEMGMGRQSTLEFGGGYNLWNLYGNEQDNKKLVHWLGQIEYRYWLCQKFAGHFLGIHALGSQFNIGGHELPLLFEKGSRNYRYEGYGYGGGISYGYQLYLSKRWNLEANVGIGYVRLSYNKYNCVKCGSKISSEKKDYVGPTKAGISLIYIIK